MSASREGAISTRIYIPKSPEEHLFFAMWLKARIPYYNPQGVETVVCYRNDTIGAVIGFSNRHYNRIEVSLASDDPRCFRKGNILTMLAPAFMPPSNCDGLTAIVFRSNKRVRKFLLGMGFIHEGTLRHAGPEGKHLLLYGLLKDEYLSLVKRFRPTVEGEARELMHG